MDEFACLILGTRSGCSVASALESMLRGFLRGIRDVDGNSRFRRIVICEIDAKRVAQIRTALNRLVRTALFDGFDVTLDGAATRTAVVSAQVPRGAPDPVYLLVRRERDRLHASLLTAGDKATVISGEKSISNLALENHLMRLAPLDLDAAELQSFGLALGRLLLPKDVLTLLDTVTSWLCTIASLPRFPGRRWSWRGKSHPRSPAG
jgi:hypothetical protein